MHTVQFSNSLCSAPRSLCGAQFARFPPRRADRFRRRRMPTEPRRPVMVSTPRKARYHWPVSHSRYSPASMPSDTNNTIRPVLPVQ